MTRRFATGSDLLAEADGDAFWVHRVWLDRDDERAPPPAEYAAWLDEWEARNPDARQVVWDGADARRFLAARYPDFVPIYDGLAREVQRCDLLRLLLLHAFGGAYVDLDVECRAPATREWRARAEPVLLARSPLFCEAHSNCIMVALERQHPFWLDVAAELRASVRALERGDGLSRTTRVFFRLPLVGAVLRFIFTSVVTGPGCVDRALASSPARWGPCVGALESAYAGPRTVHHERAAWLSPRAGRRVAAALLLFFFVTLWR